MRSLLSTKEQRQLRLLEILIQKRDWIRLNELAQTLECTERILKNDLNELRTAFPTFKIQSSINGIMLNLDTATSIEDIYIYFLSHSQSLSFRKSNHHHSLETIPN